MNSTPAAGRQSPRTVVHSAASFSAKWPQSPQGAPPAGASGCGGLGSRWGSWSTGRKSAGCSGPTTLPSPLSSVLSSPLSALLCPSLLSPSLSSLRSPLSSPLSSHLLPLSLLSSLPQRAAGSSGAGTTTQLLRSPPQSILSPLAPRPSPLAPRLSPLASRSSPLSSLISRSPLTPHHSLLATSSLTLLTARKPARNQAPLPAPLRR